MKTEKSLLEIAKEIKPGRRNRLDPSNEEIELAIAYFNGEVSWGQVRHAMKDVSNATNRMYRMSASIKHGIGNGKIERLKLIKLRS